jgi:hypothetical protein
MAPVRCQKLEMRNPNTCDQRVREHMLSGKGCYRYHWYCEVTAEKEGLDETEYSKAGIVLH